MNTMAAIGFLSWNGCRDVRAASYKLFVERCTRGSGNSSRITNKPNNIGVARMQTQRYQGFTRSRTLTMNCCC